MSPIFVKSDEESNNLCIFLDELEVSNSVICHHISVRSKETYI